MPLIFNTDKTDSCLNSFREVFSDPLKSGDDNAFNAGVILPLDFSLEMDGLSGIIPHSAFTIPTDSLPSSYLIQTGDDKGKQKIAFILHTIEQNFGENKWTTKITGQTLSIRFEPLTEKEKEDIKAAQDKQKTLSDYKDKGNKGGTCIEPYTTANLNKGWEGKKVDFVRTIVDPAVEGPKLTKKYGKVLAQAILATIQLEQGYRGFNWNLGGFDITSGGWRFNPKLHNGYVVAKEGGTGRCKAFISFISFETFIEQKVDSFTRKGFKNATTADKYAQLWYKEWNGYGARELRSDSENLKLAKNIWNNNSKYV
jgi:hypothetical protein